jgi:hypothetical protein
MDNELSLSSQAINQGFFFLKLGEVQKTDLQWKSKAADHQFSVIW